MILLLDNFDSFTYNLVDYFNQLGIEVCVKRNHLPLEEIKDGNYKGIVLSPGPEVPEKAGNLLTVIGHYHQRLPILGVCLGHQALGQFFGAKLENALKPMHGKVSEICVNSSGLFDDLPQKFNVVRYHSLILKGLPDSIKVTAKTGEGEIMAMEHKNLPIFGVQFHPEAVLTAHGLEVLKNWVRLNNIS